MILLLALSLLMCTAHSNLIKETEAYGAMEDPYEFTSPYELIDLGIDDLCSTYPSLQTSSDADLITFKKEFLEFLAEKPEVQDEILNGFPSNFRVLWGKMKELKKIATEEFVALPEDEKTFIETPTGLMLHKLGIQSALRVIAAKKADYKKRKLTKEQIKEEIEKRQLEIFHSWNGDAEMVDDEEGWNDINDEL